MTDPPRSPSILSARRRLLRWLTLLTVVVDGVSAAVCGLTPTECRRVMRAYPFAQPVRELGAAVQTWRDAARAAFATTAPQRESADVRPLDLRYYRAYVEQFAQAGGPIESHRWRVRMLEVLHYDPFGSTA